MQSDGRNYEHERKRERREITIEVHSKLQLKCSDKLLSILPESWDLWMLCCCASVYLLYLTCCLFQLIIYSLSIFVFCFYSLFLFSFFFCYYFFLSFFILFLYSLQFVVTLFSFGSFYIFIICFNLFLYVWCLLKFN